MSHIKIILFFLLFSFSLNLFILQILAWNERTSLIFLYFRFVGSTYNTMDLIIKWFGIQIIPFQTTKSLFNTSIHFWIFTLHRRGVNKYVGNCSEQHACNIAKRLQHKRNFIIALLLLWHDRVFLVSKFQTIINLKAFFNFSKLSQTFCLLSYLSQIQKY